MRKLQLLTIFWLLFVLILLLLPGSNVPKPFWFLKHLPNLDKIVHLFIFGITNFLIIKSRFSFLKNNQLKISIYVFLYSIFIECLQYLFTKDRKFEMYDILANTMGIVIVWLLFEIKSSLIKKKIVNKSLIVFFLLSTVIGYGQELPKPATEFRGVWIATVKNIDFPSSKNLSTEEQKQELISLLRFHKSLGLNAVFLQVRPHLDAFYASKIEPWSEYLTGTQGKPPLPFYDPLEFAITEAHKLGLELHAWINPYRATMSDKSSISANHLWHLHPDWFIDYGDKKYLNPGLTEVWKYTEQVVRDIIERYDIDGLHMDDYFYPYRIENKVFPDAETYKKYHRGLSLEDWRRSNCDTIVKRIYDLIKTHNKYLPFGISPFGVWRNADKDPKGSQTKAGQTNYDDLYADILKWENNGWVDYVIPQLYWEKKHPVASFDVLLPWWNIYCTKRQLYIGIGIYRNVENMKGWESPNELPNQINDIRKYTTTQGLVFFSSKSLQKENMGWKDSLKNHYFKYPALVPPYSWLPEIAISNPRIISNKTHLKILYEGVEEIKKIIILEQTATNENNIIKEIPFQQNVEIETNFIKPQSTYYIYLQGRYNHLSKGVKLEKL